MDNTPSNTYSPETAPDAEEATYYTMDEATRLIDSETRRWERAEAALNQARKDFDSRVTNHPLAQGNDAIIAELTAEHLPALEAAEREAERVADTVHANIRPIYDQTSRTQYAISPETYREIDARRGLIREDCDMLPFDRLADAVRYAILKNDTAAMYCYARYIPRRLSDGESGEWRDSAAKREKAELRRMLATIDGKLKDQTLSPVNARAGELLTKSGALQRAASKRRMAAQRYAFQSPGETKW
jgi:hypothetical protein